MRLTLRTMLAYLDGILEPEDAQDISKKIEESIFASDLIHRIRDLLRRPSIDVPDSTSSGPSLGPNAVAEYLDNTLPPHKVTEFEKICLDSDTHLAEVSACHQILTIVLGEPAEIEPASRQRMYDIYNSIPRPVEEEIPISADSQTEIVMPPIVPAYSAASTDAEPDRLLRPKPTIPDYLREPKQKYRSVSIIAAIVVAACLLIVLMKALGAFEPGTMLVNMLASMGLVHESKQVAAEMNKPTAPEAKTPATASARAKSDDKSVIGSESKSTSESTSISPNQIEPIKPDKTGTAKPVESTETEAPGSSNTNPVSKTEGDKSPDVHPETSIETPKPLLPDESAEKTAPPTATKTHDEKTPLVSAQVGHNATEEQILLAGAGQGADWQRLANKEAFSTGQRLLALPTYRPECILGNNSSETIKLQMLGGTELEILPVGEREPSGIKIHFGRIVASPVGNAGARLKIAIGERTGVLTFVDAEAVAAVEVNIVHMPGTNPETESAGVSAEFMAPAGHIAWTENGKKPVEISAPAKIKITEQSDPETAQVKEFPKWITADPVSQLDASASAIISQWLIEKSKMQPARLGLLELAIHRRKEVRWLAVRCLGYLGDFDAMVTVLDNAEAKQEWNDTIEQLREAVGRDSDTAVAVHKALESRYPQEAAEMYRMLWGYSNKNLESGDDEKLVRFLDDDNLAIRVLGYWNLKDITGKSLSYQPELSSVKRQPSIQIWKQRLKANEIRIKPAEEKTGNSTRDSQADPR